MTDTESDTLLYNYPEMELSVKLSQIEGCLKFLHYMNFDEHGDVVERPRNETERQSIKNNLERVRECRSLLKRILNGHKQKLQH